MRGEHELDKRRALGLESAHFGGARSGQHRGLSGPARVNNPTHNINSQRGRMVYLFSPAFTRRPQLFLKLRKQRAPA